MRPVPVFLGLDVGKRRDRAAWVGVVPKRLGPDELPEWVVPVCEQAPVGTPYAAVAERTRELSEAFGAGGWPVLVAVDATGIGAAVVEDLRARPGGAEILAVTSHAGKQVTGQWPDVGVPKTLLVAALDRVMQRQEARPKTVTVAPTLPAADVLKAQLKAYEEKLKAGGRGGVGRVVYEARHERDHDDMVSAVQLALYAGSRWFEISRQRTPGRD